jgi:hypothetical protein
MHEISRLIVRLSVSEARLYSMGYITPQNTLLQYPQHERRHSKANVDSLCCFLFHPLRALVEAVNGLLIQSDYIEIFILTTGFP